MTLLVLVPLGGAVASWVAGPGTRGRYVALTSTLLSLGVTASLVMQMAAGESYVWTEDLAAGSFWALRVDGLSLPLLALTALLGVVGVVASWEVKDRPNTFFALLLSLQAAVTGVFLADNVVLFYAFWEAVLVPMYFLIGVWGHEHRRHAANKFFLYTFAGSALMLVGLLIAAFTRETFALAGGPVLPAGTATLVFWLLAAGFLVKIPAWPLHTWLPLAHVEAPTAGSMMLAGVLLKMGGYGLMRVARPLAPEAMASAAPVLAALGLIGIVYGGLMALAQADLKRLVAYSSVAHMGFVLVALAVGTPLAYGAAMLVMVSHGVVAPLLFLLVGQLYDRAHTREIPRFSGMTARVPLWAAAFTFASLAGLGLPGTSGFPGELLTMLEGFRSFGWWMAMAAVGVVLAGAYSLWAVRRVNTGEPAEEWVGMRDLTGIDLAAVVPLGVVILVLGVWPRLVLTLTDGTIRALFAMAGGG